MSILSLFSQASDYDYSVYDTGANTLSPEASGAAMLGVMTFMLVILAVAYVITALSLRSIFKKAGVEGAQWKAWVPFYNMWILLELGGQKGFWAVLALVPIVNIVAAVFMYIAMYYVGLKLGKPGAFVLVGIFLPLVWYVWLAVDKSVWQDKAAGPQAPTTLSPGTPTAPSA